MLEEEGEGTGEEERGEKQEKSRRKARNKGKGSMGRKGHQQKERLKDEQRRNS